MSDETTKRIQQAVRDDRTRTMSALIKLRDRIDGKAKESAGNGKTVREAYEDAAGEVAKFIVEEFAEGGAWLENGCTTSGGR